MTEQKKTGQFLTAYVNDHYLGVSIVKIQDVIGPQDLTPVPLAHKSIAGVLNLRGRIVTAIDMRQRLDEKVTLSGLGKGMGIIIESQDELFSLVVDKVEDVMTIALSDIEKPPPTLNPAWRDLCQGVYQMDEKIMTVLDYEKVLDLGQTGAA